MIASTYSLFLADSIAPAEPNHGLSDDELYGVYTSWCLLRREFPTASPAFWTAMRERGIPDRCRIAKRVIRPGLRMTGPAAVDYILTSQPSML
ncbi:hypothetical protein ACFC25_10380 [Pseudarthrobacter sp. NPDC055928]|uniref:hypothetical protein n=1 Tax=Pseudarthrobacter sp. NPDC055928 TaxID=3345661 RepID=UPI0035DD247D